MTSIKDDSSTGNKNRQLGHKSKERERDTRNRNSLQTKKICAMYTSEKNLIKAGHDGTQLLKESTSVRVQSYPDLYKVSQAS